MTFGAKIRELRVGKGLTHEQLANGLCSPDMMVQIESREGRPSTFVLSSIADRLDVSLDNLSGESDRRAESLALYREALELKRTMDFTGARERLEELLKHPFFGVPAVELMCNLAECNLREGELLEAFHWYHFALEEACMERNHEAMITIYKDLGHIEFAQERYDFALRQFDRALAISERLPNQDVALTTHLYILQGICHNRMQNGKVAMQCFRLAVKCCEASVDRRSVAWLMLLISKFFREMSCEWEANAYTERAAGIFREVNVLDLSERLPEQYGILLGVGGVVSEVCHALQTYLCFLDEAGYDMEAGIGYVELATLLVGENLDMASEACQQASQRLPEAPEYQTCVLELQGRIACERLEYREAADLYQQAADGYKQMKQAQQWANVMRVLSWIHRELEGASVS
ncbi:helix-turn-helix transcriptional regulator [Tumebacillus permanentifrigoris]|uniref:Transcriptional regulator with XRE-family HTH domain n=1 Tax=Tumebacillus permanentifrigoris TaxID=378543 RepID=A0A316D4I1_9BACL|nr:helix-turn-helix transcriptional regulator [Tumebacillus permanentifrigoris]PWK07010.1 transcriptional regulator with XRE-family HTH domain [Tumebacillus permanentifrigoris]